MGEWTGPPSADFGGVCPFLGGRAHTQSEYLHARRVCPSVCRVSLLYMYHMHVVLTAAAVHMHMCMHMCMLCTHKDPAQRPQGGDLLLFIHLLVDVRSVLFYLY